MQPAIAPVEPAEEARPADAEPKNGTETVVSTHVLVEAADLARLRALSRRTRVAQSEYLREAVDDLLAKYGAALDEPKA